MGSSRRWLVCGGPGEFVRASSELLGAGEASGIEWEPLPVRAFARIAAAGPMDVLVMDGMFSGSPVDVAVRAAALGTGACVLCMEGAAAVAARVTALGVTAAVEPGALGGLLRQLVIERSLPGQLLRDDGWDGEPLPDELLDELARMFCRDDAAPMGLLPPAPLPAVRRDLCLPAEGVAMGAPAQGMARAGRAGGADVADGPASVEPPVARRPPGEPEPSGTPAPPAQSVPTFVWAECAPAQSAPQRPAQIAVAVPGAGEVVPTVCFSSARGGVGKSALAAVAALALAREGLNVALIDLDYQFGTCLGYLGADETEGLLDVGVDACVPPAIDERAIARCRVAVCPGVTGFEFCRAPEQAEVLVPATGALLAAARAGADVAVVDLPSGVNEVAAQAFELSDRCLLVGDHRALSLESLGLQQALCARIGVPRAKLVTVLNRCDPRHRDEGFLARAPFELQTPQIARVADGGAEVMQMLAIGGASELVAVRNRFALSTADLVRSVATDLGCLGGTGQAGRLALPPPRLASPRATDSDRRHRRRKRQRKEERPCPS